MKYMVDGEGPFTLDEMIKCNYWDHEIDGNFVGSELDDTEILELVKLKVGESMFTGMSTETKRIE